MDNISRRDLLSRGAAAAVAGPMPLTHGVGTLGAAGSMLVLHEPAHGFAPFLLAPLVAVAFDGMFNNFGFTKSMGRLLADAGTVLARERPANPHDLWNEEERVNASVAFQFVDGKLVAQIDNPVLGAIATSRNFAGRKAFVAGVGADRTTFGSANEMFSSPRDARRADLNRHELRALSASETLGDFGTMLPVTQRVAVHDQRVSEQVAGYVDAYRGASDDSRRSRRQDRVEPQYVRKFRNVQDGSEVVGVFGFEAMDDPRTRVHWLKA